MSLKKKKNVWRLILDPPRSGSFNMAADNFLLENYSYISKPVFRIYEWECPTISIGKNEILDRKINLFECEKLGIPVFRRVTGGQSVFHGFDLTYSFVGGVFNSKFTESVVENYRILAKGFFRFFKKLGLTPEYFINSVKFKDHDKHICFSIPSNYEIMIEGRKIIGNAQKVKKIKFQNYYKRSFLQHGSIPLKDSYSLISKIYPNVNIAFLKKKMHSLESTGVFPSFKKNKIKELLKKSFMETFDLEWEYKDWNEDEIKLISKYEKNFKPIKS